MDALITQIQEFIQSPEGYLCIGISLLVLFLLIVLLCRRQPKSVMAYATDSGRVMVSRAAIVELVQTSCSQLEEVSKPSVKIKVKGRTVHFEVRIKLASGGQLRSIEQTLQTHLRNALTDNLGIEDLGRIDIIATGFKSGKIDRSSTVATEPALALATDKAEDPDPEADIEETSKNASDETQSKLL